MKILISFFFSLFFLITIPNFLGASSPLKENKKQPFNNKKTLIKQKKITNEKRRLFKKTFHRTKQHRLYKNKKLSLEDLTKKTLLDQSTQFDIPIFYNKGVKRWMLYFQGKGKKNFETWLELSYRYLPFIRKTLKDKGLPQDLAFLVFIESGFSATAKSVAFAVGYWQFIQSTANQYGLKTNWWLDERRSFVKSTKAAAAYLKNLYQIFNSWYLAISAYNMGETKLLRLIKRHKTKNILLLSKKRGFPSETRNYLLKFMATMIMAKNPYDFGFKNKITKTPYHLEVDHLLIPGGVDLHNLARHSKINQFRLAQLNPEILKAFIPRHITHHMIQIPKGYRNQVSLYIKEKINKNYSPQKLQLAKELPLEGIFIKIKKQET